MKWWTQLTTTCEAACSAHHEDLPMRPSSWAALVAEVGALAISVEHPASDAGFENRSTLGRDHLFEFGGGHDMLGNNVTLRLAATPVRRSRWPGSLTVFSRHTGR